MAKQLKIKLIIDNSQAVAASARSIKDADALVAAYTGANTAIEKAFAASAKAMANATHTATAAAQASAAAQQAAHSATTASATASASSQTRANNRAGAAATAAANAAARAAQAAAQAATTAVNASAQSQQAAHAATAHAAQASSATQQQAATAASASTTSHLGQLDSVVKKWGLMAKAAAAYKLATDALKFGDDLAEGKAEGALQLHKDLRDESALMGFDKSDSRMASKHLAMRLDTTLGKAEASAFNKQFEGSLPIGIQKNNVDRDTADEFKKEAGIRAARIGGDAATHGDLAGILGQFKKYGKGKAGVGEMLGDVESVRIGLTEGRGDDTPLTQQLLKVAGSMVKEHGFVPDIKELSALIGVTSLSAGPDAAATRAEQLTRGLKGGLVKPKKGKGPSQAEYLKGLGIKETDKLIGGVGDESGMVDKVAVDLAKAEAGGRDLDSYLGEKGFRNMEERRAIVETYKNKDAWKQRVTKMQAPGQGEGQIEANKRYLMSPEGQYAKGEALKDAAGYAKGLGTIQSQALRPGQEAVQMKDEGGWGQYLGDTLGGLGRDPMNPHAAGVKSRHEDAMIEDMKAQARKLGATDKEVRSATNQWGGGIPGLGDGVMMQTRRESMDALTGVIKQRGGSVNTDAYAKEEQRVRNIIGPNASPPQLLRDQAAREQGGGGGPQAGNAKMEALLAEQNALLKQIAAQGQKPPGPTLPVVAAGANGQTR